MCARCGSSTARQLLPQAAHQAGVARPPPARAAPARHAELRHLPLRHPDAVVVAERRRRAAPQPARRLEAHARVLHLSVEGRRTGGHPAGRARARASSSPAPTSSASRFQRDRQTMATPAPSRTSPGPGTTTARRTGTSPTEKRVGSAAGCGPRPPSGRRATASARPPWPNRAICGRSTRARRGHHAAAATCRTIQIMTSSLSRTGREIADFCTSVRTGRADDVPGRRGR